MLICRMQIVSTLLCRLSHDGWGVGVRSEELFLAFEHDLMLRKHVAFQP